MRRLSIIVPTLDEANRITGALVALAPLRARGAEVIVVDGGSTDGTAEMARPFVDGLISAARGRAAQMNAGSRHARGDVLLFVHADTRLPPDADQLLLRALGASRRVWGRFDVAISGRHPLLRVIAAFMNLRSRVTGIATGDQSIFVRRDVFEAVGGYPDIPLMEDIALSSKLRRRSRPLCLSARAITSGRRWESGGILRTILLMWRLRLEYFLRRDLQRLARQYGYSPRKP